MRLETEDRKGLRVITVAEPRIDAAMAIDFKEAVRQAVGNAAGTIILNLEAVGFLDSSGLGALVATMKLLAPGCRLELAALQPNVERVFRLTKMDSVFTIHPSAEAALLAVPRLRDAG